MYLRKSFRQLQNYLDPQTVLFLGDLFDGGREWSTPPGEKDSQSADRHWRKYGEAFWLREYYRFNRIFFNTWLDRGNPTSFRKIISGLPGNHDLGLGIGIRLPVRKRFNAYFGSGNRVDLIGNHTIVSIDTVSLSAKGQPNQETIDSGDRKPEDIWGPPEDFLSDVKDEKERTIRRQLRAWQGKPENEPHSRQVYDLEDDIQQLPKAKAYESIDTDIPSILLTHVPLYRAPGTPCGPLRERFPQSRDEAGAFLENDDRNAISISAGVQYQNVLTPEISKELIEKVGDVEHVFSGDDHDYCDIVHRGFTSKNGGIHEITVKSMSWAMGVRRPGFLMLSLWNPIDKNGKYITVDPADDKASKADKTMQTHLCLLPDQLAILTRYAYLLAFTVLTLTISSFLTVYRAPKAFSSSNTSYNLLPISKPTTPTNGNSASALSTHPSQNGLTTRSNAHSHRARSASPFKGYALPVAGSDMDLKGRHKKDYAESLKNGQKKDWDDVDLGGDRKSKSHAALLMEVWYLLKRSLGTVAAVGLPWYFWLLWTS